jgi:CMP-N-acetylneuraminic acid synthetase
MLKVIDPLVTVYVTNHNYGQYIRQAMDSVFEQTFKNFEIILIDDGSTDDSRKIIEKNYSNTNINIIYQQNKGLNVTNNIASRVARGKYIMRLDADDYLDKNALLVMSNIMESDNELGLVFPDYYVVDPVGNTLFLERRHSFDKEVTLMDQPAHGACTMIKREYLLAVGGYDENFRYQDGYELWIKFTAKYKVTNVNLPLFYYRRHGENITNSEDKILDARYEIKRQYYDNSCDPIKTIAVLPTRGAMAHPGSYDMEELGNKRVIDWIIDEALLATRLSLLIVTTPDTEILEHITSRYGSNPSLLCLGRSVDEARLNVGLVQTINHVLKHPEVKKHQRQAILRLASEYPFINAANMDDAVNTLCIFGTDSLIGVRPDTSMFFQHDGGGLVPILNQDKFTRLEREALYRYVGGLTLTKLSLFKEKQAFLGGKLGHIVINQKSSHSIRCDYDLQIARYLVSN